MSERYRLVRKIADGGMAEVYLGVASGAEGFERPVAIKRIHPHLAENSEVTRLFLAEVRLATLLQHQNVVQVLDVGRSEGTVFIVMELVNGWDLADLLDALQGSGAGVPAHLVAYIASQVVAGLHHAYRKTHQGQPILVAHRDISPSNVLLSVEGEVKVADFGVAKLSANSGGSSHGGFKGKEPYASPEAVAGEPVSMLSDQFSLGLVLLELLTGKHPFGERTHYAVAISTETPTIPTTVPPRFAGILTRMLHKSPGERFADIDSLGRELATFLAQSGEPASAAELAQYLRTLPLPAPSLDRAGPAPSAVLSFSLQPRRAGFEEDFDPEWRPMGKVMDASGQLRDAAPAQLAAPLHPPAPVAQGGAPSVFEASTLELAHPPVGEIQAQEDEQELAAANAQARRRTHIPNDKPYEERLYRDLPPPPSPWPARVLVFLAVLLVLGGALALFGYHRSGGRVFNLEPQAVLYIDSEPSGATVTINGTEVGHTPVVLDNHYGEGEASFQLSLKGYRTYSGTFRGGEPVQLELKLKKR